MLTHDTARSTEALILDATRDAILAVGWRKTTLTDIARRAGVSRMTVYRLWPDTQSLLADLMTREWVALEERVLSAGGTPSATPEGIAAAVVAAVKALRDDPLLSRIVELDPELLLPYLLERPGRSQVHTLAVLAGLIGSGIEAGEIGEGRPEELAAAIVLTAHGFVLSAHTMTGAGACLAGLDDLLQRQIAALLSR